MLGTIMIVSVLLDFNVNLHEGEDHVENRVDAREDVPRAAANRHLSDLKLCLREITSKKWTNSKPVYIRVPRPKAIAPSLEKFHTLLTFLKLK